MTTPNYQIFLLLISLSTLFQWPLITCAKLIYNATADVEQKTLVRTRLGPISGLITVRNGLNISCYLGIPYAEPPIGERRFAEPTPVKVWKSKRIALQMTASLPRQNILTKV